MKQDKVEVVPTEEAWEKFWKVMDEVGVWEWKTNYDNLHIMDGQRWTLKLQRGERKVSSGGINGYPYTGEKPRSGRRTPLFIKYEKAVEALIGRPLRISE
jgi:hypothetical protein